MTIWINRRTVNVINMGELRYKYRIWIGNQKEKDSLRGLDVGGRII
jgi:hypothetical protein